LPPGLSDTSGHSLGYVGLGILVTRALAGGLPVRMSWRLALTAVALTTGYGATDEWHQMFVDGRSADVLDLRADAAGALGAVCLCWLWGILPRRSTTRGATRHDL
jgi:VanZ family protein